jgi:hypothetical protein
LLLLLLLPLLLQVRDREEAARISNAYAPEHLIVNVQDAESWLPLLDNAGSIFMGRWENTNWMRDISVGFLPCISLLLVLPQLPDWDQDHRLPDYPFWGQARLIEKYVVVFAETFHHVNALGQSAVCQAGMPQPPRLTAACCHVALHVRRWTPESVGDYASGTNHVLPTYGYARMYSGVSLDSFTKKMTVQSLSYEGLQVLGPHVAKMAEVEGLDAHRRAVTLRLGLSS